MSDTKWELRKGEEIIACEFSALGEMARSGALKREDQVRPVGHDGWQDAAAVPALSAAFKSGANAKAGTQLPEPGKKRGLMCLAGGAIVVVASIVVPVSFGAATGDLQIVQSLTRIAIGPMVVGLGLMGYGLISLIMRGRT